MERLNRNKGVIMFFKKKVPVEEKTINLAEIAKEISDRTETLEVEMPPNVMVKLINSKGEEEYSCELSSQIVIGKEGVDNDILIRGDKAVAGIQCRIYIDKTGYKLEDLGSANGTYLNDDYILGPVDIRDNDTLVIGRSEFTVKMEVC